MQRCTNVIHRPCVVVLVAMAGSACGRLGYLDRRVDASVDAFVDSTDDEGPRASTIR